MRAITTTYHGATANLPDRVTASSGRQSVTISRHDSGDIEEVHNAAAIALCRKMGWTGNLTRGWIENRAGQTIEGVYVFDNPQARIEAKP